jgi:1-pyrroline-5-carboxylate dehydrogenase
MIQAELPAGVINMVTVTPGVCPMLWGRVGQNIAYYLTYPRVVGEAFGKDFVVAHP